MHELLVLFAQAEAPAAAPPSLAQNLVGFAPLIGIIFLLYLMLLRPQQKQERARQEMIAGLKPGDRVLTAGGILGTVVSFKKEKELIVLRVDDLGKINITVTRSSIVRLIPEDKDAD